MRSRSTHDSFLSRLAGGLLRPGAALALCLIFLLGFSGAAWAERNENAPGLFISQNVPGAVNMNPASFRHRPAQIDADVLKNKNIVLNLFEDSEFDAVRDHVKKEARGAVTWSGHIVDGEGGTVNITVFGKAVAGSVSTPGQLFEINTGPGGRVTIEEIDLDLLPPHVNPSEPEGEPAGEETTGGAATLEGPAAAADTGDTIDLMVIYTQATRARYGQAGIEAKIINAVQALNDANARSGALAQFNLVHMEEVNYVETGDMGNALDRLTSKTDGYMDHVHTLRNTYGADIVSMIDEDGNYCGIAWQMNPSWLSNSFERYAFNVTLSSCMSGHTMSHEIGHNEGCAHDRANGSNGAYPYSFGHRDTTNGFRTIMSYSCPGGACPRIPNFSNPDVLYNGVPTGIDYDTDPTNSAENVRSKNNTSPIVANWRQAVSLTVPAAPSGLVASAMSVSQNAVDWTDNSNNEDGFRVERSPNGSSWVQIATVAAGETHFEDSGLSANTTYFYRARAYNGAGNSAYSNTDSATTLVPDSNPPSITAPADVTQEATGVKTAVNLGTPTVSDDTDPSPSVSANNTGPFQLGSTLVTWTATDASGNSASDTQQVTVTDSTPPSITAPADITMSSTGSIILINLGTPSVSDLADPSPDVSSDSPGSFPIGVTVVTWMATDASNNSASDTQTVTVVDSSTQPPAAPSNLTASVTATGRGKSKSKSVNLSWSDNSSNEDNFIVERCEESGKGQNKICTFAPLATLGMNVRSYSESPGSGTYKYRVRARKGTDASNYIYSGYSNEVKL